MGDYYIKLIPLDPDFVPSQETLKRVQEILPAFNSWAEHVSISIEDFPAFVDQGENFESVSCPFCNDFLDIDWWQNAMDDAFQGEFPNFTIVVPCCGKVTSLNDLGYVSEAGFARFIITLSEPGLITDDDLKRLEGELGFPLKQVKARY